MPLQVFTVALVIAVGVLVGRVVANRTGLPDAAVFVLLGVAATAVPGVRAVQLTPDVVLLLLLPPLIYYAAFFSDPRESLRNLVAVLGQATGLVVATAAVVAGVVLLVFPDIGWAAAIALGAAVAPPDPVAAGAVLQRLGVPRRLVAVLETEGLINDGVALALFALAVGAVGARLGPDDVLLHLGIEVLGGIGFGLIVAVVVLWLRRRLRDMPTHVVLSLMTPYLAFLPAESVHSSGVLATVTAAVWQSTRGRGLVEPTARQQTETFWRVLNALLQGVLFVLLGVQVPAIVAGVGEYPLWPLVVAGMAVVVATVGTRMVWMVSVAPLLERLPVREDLAAGMTWRERALLAWCGPRGAVSLAVAVSLPLATAGGAPFPRRDLLVFLAVVVVLVTLVGQTTTLPRLLRLLGLRPTAHELAEGTRARRALVGAALEQLDAIAEDDGGPPAGVDALRQVLQLRREHLHGTLEEAPRPGGDPTDLRLRLLATERSAPRKLHAQGEISRPIMVAISQELDADETALRRRGGY